MMNDPPSTSFKQLHLDGMTAAWLEQTKNAKLGTLGFDERFDLLVDAEVMHRENRWLKWLLREAKPKLRPLTITDHCSSVP